MKKMVMSMVLLLVMINSAYADIIAGIEIGLKEVKAKVVDYKGQDKEGNNVYKVIYKEEIKADLIGGSQNNLLSQNKMDEVIKVIEYYHGIIQKYNPQFFAIVGLTSFENYGNFPNFEQQVKEKTGYKLNLIKKDEELQYALATSVPKKYFNKSIIIDIGRGNTKIGYATPMNTFGFEYIPFEYGTKKLSDKVSSKTTETAAYLKELDSIAQNEIVPKIKEAKSKQPDIANPKSWIFIEGEASWAVASYAKPEDISKKYSKITLKDVKRAEQSFRDKSYYRIKPNTDDEERTYLKISDNFDSQQLQAGAKILSTILTTIDADNRKIIFNRDGGWMIGYLLYNYGK